MPLQNAKDLQNAIKTTRNKVEATTENRIFTFKELESYFEGQRTLIRTLYTVLFN